MADRIDEGTPVSRRTALVAQSALGQFQVRLVTLSLRRLHAYCYPVRIFAREIPSVTTHIYGKGGIELHLQTYNDIIPYHPYFEHWWAIRTNCIRIAKELPAAL